MILASVSSIQQLLKRYHLDPRIGAKRFGQNFLADADALEQIITCIRPTPDESIIEVGPGIGVLSSALVDTGARVTAIEFDKRLQPVLNDLQQRMPSLEIWWGDATQQAMIERMIAIRYRVVGNLAYNIATTLIERLFCHSAPTPPQGVFLIQREVAERLCAPAGSTHRGALSVMMEIWTTIESCFDVAPSCFYPQPEVWGTVIRVTPRATPHIDPLQCDAFQDFVQSCFHARRKTIRSNLTQFFARDCVIPAKAGIQKSEATRSRPPDRSDINYILDKVNIPSSKRPQDLTLEEWKHLFNVIHKD